MNDTTRRGALAAGLAALGTGIAAGPAVARRTAYRRPTLASVRRRLDRIRSRLMLSQGSDSTSLVQLRADVADLTETVGQLVAVLEDRPIR